jgi:hypothetical protein
MFRTFDRTALFSLCAVALLAVVPLLLLHDNGHRIDEQSGSSMPRASVSTGPVREVAPPADATPANPPRATPAEDAGKVRSTIEPERPKAQVRIDSSASHSGSRAHASASRHLSHAASAKRESREASHVQKRAERSRDHLRQASSRPRSDEPTPNGKSGVPVTGTDAAPSKNTSQATPRDAFVQRDAPPDVSPRAPIPATTPQPKTRQEVRDELRNARMNGTLPRFGNPDPYGPGGSPSTGN